MTFWKNQAILFHKLLNLGYLLCQKICAKIIVTHASLLGTEQGLKHFNRPLPVRSVIDFFGLLFSGSSGTLNLHTLHLNMSNLNASNLNTSNYKKSNQNVFNLT